MVPMRNLRWGAGFVLNSEDGWSMLISDPHAQIVDFDSAFNRRYVIHTPSFYHHSLPPLAVMNRNIAI